METRQDGASAAGPSDDQELAQFRKEQPIFDALMIELRGSWPQYEHYRTLLNEARGFREESQPSTAPAAQGMREAVDVLARYLDGRANKLEAVQALPVLRAALSRSQEAPAHIAACPTCKASYPRKAYHNCPGEAPAKEGGGRG